MITDVDFPTQIVFDHKEMQDYKEFDLYYAVL
jgi:hypothetical protein